MKKTIAFILALVLAAACLTGCGSGNASAEKTAGSQAEQSAEAREVHLAIQPSCAFIPLIIARESGWMDEAMKEIGVNTVWTDFESGPPMNESFAAGQQDIGVIGDVPAVSAVAAGQDNVYIACVNGAPSCAVLVLESSGIGSVADLKGKKIGLTVGSTGQNFADKLLTVYGLDINSDVELINISMGDAQVVLTNEDVDAVVVWEPNISRLEAIDGVKILADGSEAGFSGLNVVFARKAFVDGNQDIVKAYLEQYWRATKAFEENPEDYLDLLSKALNLDAGLLSAAAGKYSYVLQFSEEDVDALQDTVSFLMKIGSIKEEISVKERVVNDIAESVIKEAN